MRVGFATESNLKSTRNFLLLVVADMLQMVCCYCYYYCSCSSSISLCWEERILRYRCKKYKVKVSLCFN
jgi:hypothetical protein